MIEYKYNEPEHLDSLKKYIDNTYGQHYAKGSIQATEYIIDSGLGKGFCIGNVIKYASRYGKKEGKNKNDLYKIVHYIIMELNSLDKEHNESK